MYFLPVICVKFIPDSNLVLSASGNEISLLDIHRKTVVDRLTLSEIKIIHGIKYNEKLVIVYGGFTFSLCRITDKKLLEPLNVVRKQNDFILDCCIISCTEDRMLRFCVATAHGSTYLYQFGCSKKTKLTQLAKMVPEQKSLLYCCHLFQPDQTFKNKFRNTKDEDDIFLFGGGVQGQISIWNVIISKSMVCHVNGDDNDGNKYTMVPMPTLTNAHKGAVFGIHVHENGSMMVSVGDDRYVVLWRKTVRRSITVEQTQTRPLGEHELEINVNQDNEDESGIFWERQQTLFGHDARVWSGMVLDDHGHFIVTWGEDCTVRLWNTTTRNGIDGKVGGTFVELARPHSGRSIWGGDVRIRGGGKDEEVTNVSGDYDTEVNGIVSVVTGGNDGAVVVTDFPMATDKNILRPKITTLKIAVENQEESQNEIEEREKKGCLKSKTDFPRNVFLLQFRQQNIVTVVTDHGQLYWSDGNHENCGGDFEKTATTTSLQKVSETDIDPRSIASYCSVFVSSCAPSSTNRHPIFFDQDSTIDEHSTSEITVLFGNIHGKVIVSKASLVTGKEEKSRLKFETLQTLETGSKVMKIDKGLDDDDVLVALANGEIISLQPSQRELLDESQTEASSTDSPAPTQFNVIHYVTLPEKTWATCWTLWNDVTDCNTIRFVCGDRDGRLHAFRLDKSELENQRRLTERNIDSMTIKSSAHLVSRALHGVEIQNPAKRNGSITSLFWHKNNIYGNYGGRIYVGNKTGEVYALSADFDDDYLSQTPLQIETVVKDPDVLGWVCRIEMVAPDSDEIIVTGFRSVFFRRISVTHNTENGRDVPFSVMIEHDCGGGHRDWDYANHQLVYIGQRSVHIASWMKNSLRSLSMVVKPHLHGKEINFAMILHQTKSEIVLISGSEDCSLGLVSLINSEDDEKDSKQICPNQDSYSSESLPLSANSFDRSNSVHIRKVNGHISSVRCGTRVKGTDFVVTAGGRGHVMFWRTLSSRSTKEGDDDRKSIHPVASTLLPKLMKQNNKNVLGFMNVSTTNIDPRVMDVCSVAANVDDGIISGTKEILVGLALSNGTMVLVSLSSSKSSTNSRQFWKPKVELEYRLASSCITNVTFVNDLFIACSTNGNILWIPFLITSESFNCASHSPPSSISSTSFKVEPLYSQPLSIQVAPAALHGMDILSSKYHHQSIYISVGGDDGSVVVSELVLHTNKSISNWKMDRFSRFALAHSGSTVATRWIPNGEQMTFTSLGSDGYIILWNVTSSSESDFVLHPLNKYSVTVTDPHSMTVVNWGNQLTDEEYISDKKSSPCWMIYVVGMGAQLISIDLKGGK